MLRQDRLQRLIKVLHETLEDVEKEHGGTPTEDEAQEERQFFEKVSNQHWQADGAIGGCSKVERDGANLG